MHEFGCCIFLSACQVPYFSLFFLYMISIWLVLLPFPFRYIIRCFSIYTIHKLMCPRFKVLLYKPAPIAQLVECPLRGTGGHGFDPAPRHTKVVKNGTSCSSLVTQTYGVELGLVDPVSGSCDWVWYHVKCLGHDTSVRQHYKSEH